MLPSLHEAVEKDPHWIDRTYPNGSGPSLPGLSRVTGLGDQLADAVGGLHATKPHGGVTSPEGADRVESSAQALAGIISSMAELIAAYSPPMPIPAMRSVRHASPTEPLSATRSELLRLTVPRPGISVAEAARELRLAPNTVSTIVGSLAAQGLITRGRLLADGRTVRLNATNKARQRLAQRRDLRAELVAHARAGLPADDREALGAAIPALMRLAELAAAPPAQPHADGGTAWRADFARTGAPRGAARPHAATLQGQL